MLQAITTKYHGPTNTKGSRFSATCRAGRVVVSYDYSLDANDNHIAAANALREKLGWMDADMKSGKNHKDEGVHVLYHVTPDRVERPAPLCNCMKCTQERTSYKVTNDAMDALSDSMNPVGGA